MMKKRRVSIEELKKMKTIIVIWHLYVSVDEEEWLMLDFKLGTNTWGDIVLCEASDPCVNLPDYYHESGSLEEVLLKAELAYPAQPVHMVAICNRPFVAPCSCIIDDKNVQIFEVIP